MRDSDSKKWVAGPEEMNYPLKTLAAVTEDMGLVLSTHIAAHNSQI